MEQSADDLIFQFRRGSSHAYTAIYNLMAPSIYYFARRLVEDKEAAEDITADTFIKLYQMSPNFNSLPNIRAFLFVTTRNACLNYLRNLKVKNQRTSDLLYLLSNGQEKTFPEDEYRVELLQHIYDEIENLPTKCKQVFKLAYLEGLKNDEIAKLLHINNQSVKNQKTRALKILRLALSGKALLALLLTKMYKIL
jgi:RNA polymerase sigma-70 factor (family 1)